MTIAIEAIRQISVNARDIGRASAFYREKLKLKHLFDAPPRMSFFDCGGVRLMLTHPEGGEFAHASSILYFGVADIEAAHRELEANGVKFRTAPHRVAVVGAKELWLAFFEDTEGNVMALSGEKQA